mmetsp:Transcript_7762/g.20272  ORF Transcript_7762/g.20272 Transcript_7762/m.20272 type:complete len:87 (-) Transcript_7762:654-914(-)
MLDGCEYQMTVQSARSPPPTRANAGLCSCYARATGHSMLGVLAEREAEANTTILYISSLSLCPLSPSAPSAARLVAFVVPQSMPSW